MDWKKKKFDPARFYSWTVACKSIRDAKKGRAWEEDCATGPTRLARIEQVKDDCMAKIFEYRDRNSSHREDRSPSSFREGVTPVVLFRPRDVGGELTGVLPSLDELLRRHRQAGDEVLRSAQASLGELLNRQAGGNMDEMIHSVREGNNHDAR